MNIRKTFTGGEPDVRLDQILFGSNDDLRLALVASLATYAVGTNPNYTINGCVVSVGGVAPNNTWSMTAGYIYLNDEILQVDVQSGGFDETTEFLAFSKDITYRADGDKTFIDATPQQTLQQNRGLITVQGSVSITELDAIDGDGLEDKIRFLTTGTLLVKIIEIGDWDMDTDSLVDISYPSGITDENIITMVAIIIDDTSTARHMLIGDFGGPTSEGGAITSNSAIPGIRLSRVTGGFFDNAFYDSTSFNRGYITITYLP